MGQFEIDKTKTEKCVIFPNPRSCKLKSNNFVKQLIDSPTCSGIKGKRIDHAYAAFSDFKATGHVLYKCFVNSYHHPICVNVQPISNCL